MGDEYTLTKSAVESYKLRHSSGMAWADIIVDANGNAGRIQIASDFGDWQCYWGHCGLPFKEFLLKLEKDYLARKFGAKNHFSLRLNIDNLKSSVIMYRKSGDISCDRARKIWNEITYVEDESTDNENHFCSLIYDTEHVRQLYYDGFDVVKTYSPGFVEFWSNVWPVFVSGLKTEITA